MLPYIGQDVTYNGKLYHVQDRDLIDQSAKIGIPDINGFIWNWLWVPFSKLKEKE